MITTIFTICSLRTNIVFFSALFTLIFAFGCAAGAFWNLALGHAELGKKLTIVSNIYIPLSPLPLFGFPTSFLGNEGREVLDLQTF